MSLSALFTVGEFELLTQVIFDLVIAKNVEALTIILFADYKASSFRLLSLTLWITM